MIRRRREKQNSPNYVNRYILMRPQIESLEAHEEEKQ